MAARFDNNEIRGIGVTSQRVRDRMVEALANEGIRDPEILSLMAQAPRHLFVEGAFGHHAYRSEALPIGFNQTLSQPWIVARMSELVHEEAPGRVLEIGTGSGFQTYILSRLCKEVFSIERIQALSVKARQRLQRLSLSNVYLRHGDGQHGWPNMAPFDVILVTACTPEIYPSWIDQLKTGGVVIAPLANKVTGQQCLVSVRKLSHSVETTHLGDVNFVPLLEGVIR